jgi:hypothetical protein
VLLTALDDNTILKICQIFWYEFKTLLQSPFQNNLKKKLSIPASLNISEKYYYLLSSKIMDQLA